jgi:hypothetical protein
MCIKTEAFFIVAQNGVFGVVPNGARARWWRNWPGAIVDIGSHEGIKKSVRKAFVNLL